MFYFLLLQKGGVSTRPGCQTRRLRFANASLPLLSLLHLQARRRAKSTLHPVRIFGSYVLLVLVA